MKASGKRNIKNGNKYNKYFKPAKMEVEELDKGDVYDTLDRIQNIVHSTLDQTQAISKLLHSNSLHQTLNNVWSFLYNHIQYKEDQPGIEQLRTPLRSWADRKSGIDCDCFTIFISSILTNLAIPHSLRITEYNSKGHFQHVYVVVPKDGANINGRSSYIVVDPVVDYFNYEVEFTNKHDKKMKIRHQVLNGTPKIEAGSTFGSEFDILEGLGSVSDDAVTAAMKKHLSNTLVELNKNKQAVSQFVDSDVFKEQLEYVLENWDDPIARMATLEEMEEMEVLSEVAPSNGVSGVSFGASKALTKVKQLRQRRATQRRVVPAVIKRGTLPKAVLKNTKIPSVKPSASNVRKVAKMNCSCTSLSGLDGLGGFFSKVKNALSKAKSKVSNTVKKVGQGVKTAAKAVVKYNPVTLAMRGGMLLALKYNLMKVTERLKYGYLTESQARQRGLDLYEWRKVVTAKNMAEQFYKGIGGDVNKFKQAVLNGKNGGLGEPITMASATTAVSALMAKIGSVLKNIKFDKLKNAVNKVKTVVNKNKGVIDTVKNLLPTNSNVRSQPINPDYITVQPTPEVRPEVDTPPKNDDDNSNNMLLVGGGIGLLLLGYYALNSSKSSNEGKQLKGPQKKVKHTTI